mgnify:CR=1 FL=1
MLTLTQMLRAHGVVGKFVEFFGPGLSSLSIADRATLSNMSPEGGATATLETVWCMPEKTPFDIDERMSIIGTEGIIHIQDTFPNLGIVDASRLHSPDTTYWPMIQKGIDILAAFFNKTGVFTK